LDPGDAPLIQLEVEDKIIKILTQYWYKNSISNHKIMFSFLIACCRCRAFFYVRVLSKWYNIGQLPGECLQHDALIMVRTKYLHGQLQNRSPYRAMNGGGDYKIDHPTGR